MTTKDKSTLAAVAILAAALAVCSLFGGVARTEAATEATREAAYLACMADKLGALELGDLDPRVQKSFVRQCSDRV